MATDYAAIWKKAEPDVEYTAAMLGIAPASMTAMVRRHMFEVVKETSPKTYRKVKDNYLPAVLEFLQKNLHSDYFDIKKSGAELGMLCSMKNNQIYDCWEQPYDITGIEYVEIHQFGRFYPQTGEFMKIEKGTVTLQ